MKIQKMFNVIIYEHEVKKAIYEYLERYGFCSDCLTLMRKEGWVLDAVGEEFAICINGSIDEVIP